MLQLLFELLRAIDDPELLRKVTPDDEVGCKRIMLTDDWYPTLTKPNVELVTDRVAEVTPVGIRTADETERPADVLVLATGFKTHGFVAPMEITGEDGRIQVAFVDDLIGMRDGHDPDSPVLIFTEAEWDAFVAGAKDGEFDLPDEL